MARRAMVRSLALALAAAVMLSLVPAQPLGTEPVRRKMPPAPSSLTVAAVGDVMLSRGLTNATRRHGPDYPFAVLGARLAAADLAMANLESPLADCGSPLPGKAICFRGQPELAGALQRAGFDVLSLANNHSLDYDWPALEQTLTLLAAHGVHSVGAGRDLRQARRPVILERQGIKVGILAYTDFADLYYDSRYPRRFRATADLPGVAPLVPAEACADVAALRARVDLLVVSLHWGVEYSPRPTGDQRQAAHALADAGADLILGHHPHVVQGVEVYGRTVIAYSLGNFVFDQVHPEETRYGILLEASADRQGVRSVCLLPVYLTHGQPAPTPEARQLLPQLAALSAELGTPLCVQGDCACWWAPR